MEPYLIVAGDLGQTGGMDRANLELARHVLKQGHELHVVAHGVSRELMESRGVRIHHVVRPLRLGLLVERGLDIVGHRVAARLPKNTRVVVNGGNCALAGVNWVHYVHAADPSAGATLRGRARRLIAGRSERRAIRKAKLVVANSERTRREVIELLGVPANLVRTVYCGVDVNRFRPASNAAREERAISLGLVPTIRRIVFLGSLGDERKGFGVLFEVWRTVARQWPNCELLVVGAGRLLRKWIKATEVAGLGDKVRFMGQRDDVADILQCSDLLIAPSSYEPYGLNIAEALSSGIPAIASKKSGACELIQGELENLLLVEPSSARELKAKMDLWRGAMSKYQTAALLASTTFRAHSWEQMSGDVYGLIEDAYR